MFKYSLLLLVLCANVFAGSLQWEKMEGPYGGYGRAIDANNSISAIATNYGLYYKKSDKTEWKQISVTGDDFRFSAVRTIGDTVYAGNDNGTILRYIPNLQQMDFLPVQDGDIAAGSILSIFVEDQHIVVGTAINQIFVSDDGGTTWKITHTTDGENYSFINDMAY